VTRGRGKRRASKEDIAWAEVRNMASNRPTTKTTQRNKEKQKEKRTGKD
jgi:hypothetical protein